MPIEIMELVVRASVGNTNQTGQAGYESGSSDVGEASRRQIVQDCVDQVLDILRERQER